jgi:hypothetical protein
MACASTKVAQQEAADNAMNRWGRCLMIIKAMLRSWLLGRAAEDPKQNAPCDVLIDYCYHGKAFSSFTFELVMQSRFSDAVQKRR